MYNNTRIYDLSFVGPVKRPYKHPWIVFTIDPSRLEGLVTVLHKFSERTKTKEYFGIEKRFQLPIADLFGNREFGYGKCGRVKVSDDRVDFCIELKKSSLFDVALTINVLTHSLNFGFTGESVPTNQYQQLELETVCAQSAVYGHAVGGNASPPLLRWLKAKGASSGDMFGHTSMPKSVVTAMRQAWYAISADRQRRWASECHGAITKDGRFTLECFGNACDVAIYPDGYYGNTDHDTRFSCHNLDTAVQQITLIAGLAKLCELAREEG